MSSVFLILYTLCNFPQYYTIVDSRGYLIVRYEKNVLDVVQERIDNRAFSYREIELKVIKKGMCL